MWTCPKCETVMKDDAGACLACGAPSEGVQHWQPAPGWEFEPEPVPPKAEVARRKAPHVNVPVVKDLDEGRWISEWGNRASRVGCVLGFAGGLFVSLSILLVLLTIPSSEVSGGALATGLTLILLLPLFAAALCSLLAACAGILLEALVKTLEGRPAGVEEAIALHTEGEGRRARPVPRQAPPGNKEPESEPGDTAVRPAGEADITRHPEENHHEPPADA
jgi:hypothetical protein